MSYPAHSHGDGGCNRDHPSEHDESTIVSVSDDSGEAHV